MAERYRHRADSEFRCREWQPTHKINIKYFGLVSSTFSRTFLGDADDDDDDDGDERGSCCTACVHVCHCV